MLKRRFWKMTAACALLLAALILAGISAGCAGAGEAEVNVDFASEEGWLEIVRVSVAGNTPRFEKAGRAAIEDGTITEIEVEFPAYPWEKSGSVEEYREHVWLKFGGAMEKTGEDGRRAEGLLSYDGQYFLVAEEDGVQYVYGVGEGSDISGITLEALVEKIAERQKSSEDSGGIVY